MEQTDGKPVFIVTSPKFYILEQFWVSQVWQKFFPYLYRSLLSTLYVHGLGRPVLHERHLRGRGERRRHERGHEQGVHLRGEVNDGNVGFF